MARTTMAMAMAMKAVLLVAVLFLSPCASLASVEESMPALLAHIREIQRLAKAAHEDLVEVDQPEQLDLISSSLAAPVESEQSAQSAQSEQYEPETDPTSQLFAHIHAVQRKAQEAAEEWEKLNGEEKAQQLVEDVKEEETEADPATDALVQTRFDQLDGALKFLNNKVDGENTHGDDDALKFVHQFVLETDQSHKHDEVADESPVKSEEQTDAASQLYPHIYAVKRKAQEAEKLNGEEKEEVVELVEEEADPATDALVQARFNQLNAALKFLSNKDDVESTQWSTDADDDASNLLHQFVQNRHLETDQSHKHDEIASSHPAESEPEADATSQLFGHIHAVQRKAAEVEKLNGEEKEELVKLVEEEADPVTDALVQARFNQLNAALKFLNNEGDAESTQWSANADDDAINFLHQFVQNRQLETDQDQKHDESASSHPAASEPEADATSQLFTHIYAVQRKAVEELEKLNGEEKEELVKLVEEEADPVTDALVQARFNQLNAALKFLNNKGDAESTQWGADADDDAINLLHQFVQNWHLETDQSHKHDKIAPSHPAESEPEADATSQLFGHIHAVQRKAAAELEKLNGEEKEELVELVKEEADPATDALVQARFNQLNAALKFLNNKDDAESTQWSADADDDAINLLHQFVQNRQLETDQDLHAVQRKAAEEVEKLNGEEKEELVELVKEEADPATDALVQARFNQLNAALKFLNNKDDAESTQWSADADDDAINLLHQFVQNWHLETDQSHKHGEIGHKCDHDLAKLILPEEIAEEEDLLQHSFDGENYASVDHLFRSSAPKLGVWMRAMGCSLLVSMASLICLLLLPCIFSNGKPSEKIVNALASFGAGAMLGDAFLHQIPHAYGHSESPHLQGLHEPHHDHIPSAGQGHAHSLQDLSIGLAVLCGILVFFIVEKVVRRYEELSSEGGQRTLGHVHHHQKRKKKAKQLESPIAALEVPGTFENKEPNSLETKSSDTKKSKNSKKKDTASGSNQIFAAQVQSSGGFVTGYLKLFSDAVHNFTGGMALGSAFLLHGTVAGWSRTLFLLAHELPQEVGDFGILVKSGFSVFEALAFNFLSALVALAGTAAALMLGGSSGHSSLIEGFITGGFIYMSVGGVMPSMHDQGASLSSSLSQLVPLVLGMGVAIVISLC